MGDIQIREAVHSLVRNFASCSYPLSHSQIFTLIPVLVEKSYLSSMLNDMVVGGELAKDEKNGWFAMLDSTHCFGERIRRKAITTHKLRKAQLFIKLLSILPFIKCIGLTGSCALENARDDDDVDIMIITSSRTLFLCRLYATLLTMALGVRRKRGEGMAKGLICTNIWIDEVDMTIPPQKRGLYSARELVNIAVLINKNHTWEQFTSVNSWVLDILSNSSPVIEKVEGQIKHPNHFFSKLNMLLGNLQLWYMKSHVTNEFISRHQLWLHPQVRS